MSKENKDKANAAEARSRQTRGFMQQVRVVARRKYTPEEKVRIVREGFRRERAKVTEYWKDYQDCAELFGERRGVLPYKQLSPDWQPLVPQAIGCLASAWARLAADVGEVNATLILEKEWGAPLPREVIENGLLQKARFTHIN